MTLATAAFLAAWRASNRRAVALVRLDVASPSALTLRFGTDLVTTPDGSTWPPTLQPTGNIAAANTMMGTDVALATATFAVKATDALVAALTTYQVVGARVRVYLWERSLTTWDDAAGAGDNLLRFDGVVQTYSTRTGEVAFKCIQPRDWNATITPRAVTRPEFPQASEDVVGEALPVVIGRVGGPPLRRPFLSGYSAMQHAREKFAGGRRVASAVMVDQGRGGVAKPRALVLVAGHAVAQVGVVDAFGTACFLKGDDGLAHVIDPDPSDIVNGATGAGFYLPDGVGTAFAPIYPVDIELTATAADNGRAILDRKNETTCATLDYSAGTSTLYARLGTIQKPGRMVKATAYCIYRSSANFYGATLKLLRSTLPASDPTFVAASCPSTSMALTASTTETMATLDLGSSWSVGWGVGGMPTNEWSFNDCLLAVQFDGASPAGWVEVVQMGVAVEYVPDRDVVAVTKTLTEAVVPRAVRPGAHAGAAMIHPWWSHGKTVFAKRDVVSNVTQMAGQFFANVFGIPDADGSLTGTVGAVVERVPDVVRLILSRFGGMGTDRLVVEAGALGSFVDARALCVMPNGQDMVLGVQFADARDIATVLAQVMTAGAVEVYLSEFDNRWRVLPWVVGPAVTYGRAVAMADLLDPQTGVATEAMPDSSIVSGITVQYAYDALTRGYDGNVALSGTASSGGYGYRNLRDEYLTVVAGVNDKVDVVGASSGTHIFTLPAGVWSRDDVIGTVLPTAFPSGSWHRALAHGGRIRAGVNDRLPFNDGADKDAYLYPGDYTMEALAAHVGAKLTAFGGSPWSCTYDRATRRFTVSRSPGYSGSLRFGTRSAAGATGLCAAVLGFGIADYAAPVTMSGDVEPKVTVRAGVNNTFCVREGGTRRDCVLAAGTYTMSALAAAAQAAIRAVGSSSWTVTYDATADRFAFDTGGTLFNYLNFGYSGSNAEGMFGFPHADTTTGHRTWTAPGPPVVTVWAGVNAALPFNDGADKTATLDAGTYTFAQLAAAAQSKVDSLSTNFTFTYDATARRVTAVRSSGTASLRFSLLTTTSCASLLGYATHDYTGGITRVSLTGDADVSEDIVAVASDEEFDIRWRTGTNGLLGTKLSAWEVLGFDWQSDSRGIGLGSAGKVHAGVCPKSDREARVAASDAVFGVKRPVAVDGLALYDTDTARELRNRIFDVLGMSRTVVRFSSERLPDLQRGDVFAFAADMDTLRPYPAFGTDGSWVGKVFRVLEVHQNFGETWHTEVVAVDMTTAP